TGGSLLARVRRILREPLTDESRSKSGAATVVLTLVFTAGAGAVQQLPSWLGLPGDARVSATRATEGDARLKPRAPSVASASRAWRARLSSAEALAKASHPTARTDEWSARLLSAEA